MAILTTIDNTSQMPLGVMATTTQYTAFTLPDTVMAGDYCWCRVCEYEELAFASSDGNKTDVSSFLFAVADGNDTVAMTLWKNGAQVDLLDNNDNGTFYDFGIVGTYYKGYRINWKTVYDLHGPGVYKIKCSYTLLGLPYTYESHSFRCIGWNETMANGTVKVEMYHNGYVQSGIFDLTGKNWYQAQRFYGSFNNKQPVLETDNYLDSDRNRIQIQANIKNTYLLNLPRLSGAVKDALIEEGILANEIFITDYGIANDDKYKRIAVDPINIETVNYRYTSPGASVVLKFAARKENIIKRNNFFGTSRVSSTGVCDPVFVTINGTLMGQTPSGSTWAQIVKNEAGTQVGSKSGNDWVVPNSEFDVDITDRWGNALPQETVTSNVTVNHSTYNFISEYIAHQSTANWGGSANVTAIGTAVTAMVNAGLWVPGKLQYINPHAGIATLGHSINLRYPYAKRSAYQSVYGADASHDKYGVGFLTGTQECREETFFSPLIHSDLNSFAFGVTITSNVTSLVSTTQHMMMQNNYIAADNRGCQLSIRPSDGRVLYKCNSPGGTGPNYTPGAAPTDYTGKAYDVVRVASNEVHLYVDGSLVSTTANTSTNVNANGDNLTSATFRVGNAGAIIATCKIGTVWAGSLTQAETVTLRGIIATLETTLRA